jgi:hypothetical protein
MMPGTVVQAWENAENACFGYLQEQLGGDLDKNAFIGEIPITFDYENEPGMWYFSLKGGGTPIDRAHNMGKPGGWDLFAMAAEWGGVWKERKEAFRMAGLFLQNMPIVQDSLEGVMRFQVDTYPEIIRLNMERKSDSGLGGEIRLWQVVSECLVTFRPVEVAE